MVLWLREMILRAASTRFPAGQDIVSITNSLGSCLPSYRLQVTLQEWALVLRVLGLEHLSLIR